ncbi:transglutaminase-like domain-containing protein [Aminipila sp.]|uniref:transglutaminase-like domain-containing protein n=1 Tax=Aminipila sp. TaxID=2060095 RepID=UPI0028A0DDFC|nr:transglutaminase-like domain-containing protein [Aminipila sp.]
MNIFNHINGISILMLGIFFMPLMIGLLSPISGNKIHHSLQSALNSFNVIIATVLAFYLVRALFSGAENSFFAPVLQLITPMKDFILRYNHDIAAYIIALFVILAILLWFLEIITIPLYKYAIVPSVKKLSSVFDSLSRRRQQLLSILWQLPKSICMLLIFSLLLNFYSTFVNNPAANEYINDSATYQLMNKAVIKPMLNTNIAKNLPVLFNDSFKKAAEDLTPANNENGENPNYWKVTVIKYFNGVTLDEAIKSSPEIDAAAKKIVGSETNDIKKARLLYEWVSKNIQYDDAKAQIIVRDPSHVNSGSIVTFAEREGICFDYSCLYISMCRSVGLKVRFVTGLAYNGSAWGDHAWNQIYSSDENRWINVDTTFGNSGYNYFDNSNFAENHKYDVIQGEW